ncbi:hypothetical protein V1523DRAFT_427734 [Lipomyces doorenjongii]
MSAACLERLLMTKKIANADEKPPVQLKALAQNPDERAPNRSITAGEDITEAIDFLSTRQNYLVRRLAVNNGDAQIDGFVFAARENIITLRQRGYLTLFDSTYATNAHNYPLFSFMRKVIKTEIFDPADALAMATSNKSSGWGRMNKGERIQEDEKRSAQNFRTQQLKEADELPQLNRFPLPVQKLTVEELDALRHIGDDDPARAIR